MSESVKYPMRDETKKSKWNDPEFRKEWNKNYRKQIKEGKREPIKRSEEPSKWDNPLFRGAYDKARQEKLAQDRKEKKLSFEEIADKKPNYTNEEKQIILDKMLEMVRQGKKPVHPYFELSLSVKNDYIRKQSRSKKN